MDPEDIQLVRGAAAELGVDPSQAVEAVRLHYADIVVGTSVREFLRDLIRQGILQVGASPAAQGVQQVGQSGVFWPIPNRSVGENVTLGFGAKQGYFPPFLAFADPRAKNVGLDIGEPVGTPLHSPVSGTVREVRRFDTPSNLYGNSVEIRSDDGSIHRLSHLRDVPTQKTGQRVLAGEQLGFVGNTGNNSNRGTARGILDWEYKGPDGQFADPLSVVTQPTPASPVRDVQQSREMTGATGQGAPRVAGSSRSYSEGERSYINEEGISPVEKAYRTATIELNVADEHIEALRAWKATHEQKIALGQVSSTDPDSVRYGSPSGSGINREISQAETRRNNAYTKWISTATQYNAQQERKNRKTEQTVRINADRTVTIFDPEAKTVQTIGTAAAEKFQAFNLGEGGLYSFNPDTGAAEQLVAPRSAGVQVVTEPSGRFTVVRRETGREVPPVEGERRDVLDQKARELRDISDQAEAEIARLKGLRSQRQQQAIDRFLNQELTYEEAQKEIEKERLLFLTEQERLARETETRAQRAQAVIESTEARQIVQLGASLAEARHIGAVARTGGPVDVNAPPITVQVPFGTPEESVGQRILREYGFVVSPQGTGLTYKPKEARLPPLALPQQQQAVQQGPPQEIAEDLGEGWAQNYLVHPDGRRELSGSPYRIPSVPVAFVGSENGQALIQPRRIGGLIAEEELGPELTPRVPIAYAGAA